MTFPEFQLRFWRQYPLEWQQQRLKNSQKFEHAWKLEDTDQIQEIAARLVNGEAKSIGAARKRREVNKLIEDLL